MNSQFVVPTQEWAFELIKTENPERGTHLEVSGDSSELADQLEIAMSQAIKSDMYRLGLDSKENNYKECRVSLQFKVDVSVWEDLRPEKNGAVDGI